MKLTLLAENLSYLLGFEMVSGDCLKKCWTLARNYGFQLFVSWILPYLKIITNIDSWVISFNLNSCCGAQLAGAVEHTDCISAEG